MDRESEHFGLWLRRQIEERMLTQAAFAERCGVPFYTLRNWLASARPAIRGVNVVRLARGLEIDRAEIDERLHRDDSVAA